MGTKVQLPPGCVGFDCADGSKLTADKPGGTVEVSDRHARAINSSQYGDTEFITAKNSLSFGTRRGQRCPQCPRIWNAWTTVCPKCDVATIPE